MRLFQLLIVGIVSCLGLMSLSLQLFAAVDPVEFESDPVLEKRYQLLTQTLRCPKCQNQSIAGSDAPIATDMRRKVEQMLREGQSDQKIEDFMIQRYGDYVTYDPPFKARTYVLWFGPPVFLLVIALSFWFAFFRQKPVKPSEGES